MDEQTRTLVGIVLLVVGGVLILAFAFPSFAIPVTVPIPLAIVAALGMAVGTLLVGTSTDMV